MKHTIELKMPKLFNKKKVDNEPEVVTEVDLNEMKENEDLKNVGKIAVAVVAGLTVGYLVGFNKGIAVANKIGNVIVFKD